MSISAVSWQLAWQVHFTRRRLPWPAEPRPLLALWGPGELAGWLDAEDIPEGLPFLLDPAGGYDVELNRYLLCVQVFAAPLNTRRAIAYDLADWLSFCGATAGGPTGGRRPATTARPTSAGAAGTPMARTWRARPGRGRSQASTGSTGGRSVRVWSPRARSSSGRCGSGGAGAGGPRARRPRRSVRMTPAGTSSPGCRRPATGPGVMSGCAATGPTGWPTRRFVVAMRPVTRRSAT